MLLPNKFVSTSESTISVALRLLMSEHINGFRVQQAFFRNREIVNSPEDFIDGLTLLYALGVIELDEVNGVIENVD